jgi:Rrf2 family transcriptional regulator, nitric oxide-sensitive transcriptional repressor
VISQTAEYALRAVVCLAQRHDQALTTHEIARQTRVPAGYLSKVLQALGRANLVLSQRGFHGGFTLALPPAELTVLRILNAVDPVKRIPSCPLKLTGHSGQLCPLHRRLDQAAASVEAAFAKTTIAELLAEPTASTPLCDCATADDAAAGEKRGA